MYLIRRVFRCKPGTARRAAEQITKIGKAYENAGPQAQNRMALGVKGDGMLGQWYTLSPPPACVGNAKTPSNPVRRATNAVPGVTPPSLLAAAPWSAPPASPDSRRIIRAGIPAQAWEYRLGCRSALFLREGGWPRLRPLGRCIHACTLFSSGTWDAFGRKMMPSLVR